MSPVETIDTLFARTLHLEASNRQLRQENDTLRGAVTILALPRTTEAQIEATREELIKVIHMAPIKERIGM